VGKYADERYARRGSLLKIKTLAAVVCFGVSGLALANPAPTRPPIPEEEIVNHYLGATQARQDSTHGSTIEMDIDASVPSLQKHGKLHALKNITKLGKITFHVLGFTGDNTVKTEVIAKYLKAEVDAAQNGTSVSITPDHYKFKYHGTEDFHGHQAYVLRVTPREKKVGYFKGELWLDAETYMPVRESGSFVKTPSMFLKKMQFVREYGLQDGVYVPQRMESKADVRFIGPVQLNINYLRYSKDDQEESVGVASDQQ
jgi:Outer membrane lipoprotein-sorting protein